MIATLHDQGILVSLFVDPDMAQITAAADAKAYAIEIHTGKYAASKDVFHINDEYYKIKDMSELADSLDLVVNAGHGLNYHNVKPIARLPQLHELNIGFAIIAQSVFWGLPKAVATMKQSMLEERG